MELEGLSLSSSSNSIPIPSPIVTLMSKDSAESSAINATVKPDLKSSLGGCLLKKTRHSLFESIPETNKEHVRLSCIMRMRFIDSVRFHKPTEDEQKLFNVSSSVERLNLHNLNDVLTICGARQGIRFQPHHVENLRELTQTMDKIFQEIDSFYRQLPIESSRMKFQEEFTIEIEEKNIEKMKKNELLALCQLYNQEFTSKTISLVKIEKSEEEEKEKNKLKKQQEYAKILAIEFHKLANLYLDKLRILRDIISDITKGKDKTIKLSDPVDKADLNKITKQSITENTFPDFLWTLLQLYRRENMLQPWNPGSEEPPVESLYIFASFLSTCLSKNQPFSLEEQNSLAMLLHMTNIDADMNEYGILIVRRELEKQLTRKLWQFLSNVRELRRIPRGRNLTDS